MLFVGTSIIHPSTEGVFLLCNILDLLIYSKKFKILIFDNDLFLEQQRGNIPKDILDGFSEEQKAQVIETLFAYMTRAYFWNKSPRNNMIEDRISKEIINGNIKIQKLGDKKVIFKGKIIEEY